MTNSQMMKKCQKETGLTWIKNGKDFQEGSTAVLWSGEGANVLVKGELLPAFDYYSEWYDQYEIGVNMVLVEWAKKNGLMWECQDPGTYLAWKS